MKNYLFNKQTIKALAIGLSASMAMQPVTAFAEEGENSTTDENTLTLSAESTDSQDHSETFEEAEGSVTEADTAIDNAAEAVEQADAATDADYSKAQEALDDANREVEDAAIQVGAANITNTEAEELKDKVGVDLTLIDDKTKEAEDTYKEAVDAAKEAEEISESINTETTSQQDAEKAVEEVNKNVETAKEKLDKANETLEEAQKVYDEALSAYTELELDVNATESSLNAAKEDLDAAKKVLEDAQSSVDDAQEAVDDEFKAVKEAGYQKIIEAQEEISSMTGDEEDYQEKLDELTKLIIKYYILENEEIDEDSEPQFGEESYGVVTDYEKDEDGNYVTDEQGNYIPVQSEVTIKYVSYMVDGKEVVKTYEASETDGSISVSEKTIELAAEDVTLKEGVKESYTTEDGSSTYVETETSHIVYIDSEDEHKGFYAIDTANTDSVISTKDNTPEDYSDDTTTVVYKEIEGSEETTYDQVEEHTVIDSYTTETVAVEDPKTFSYNWWDLVNTVDDYRDQGYDVRITYYHKYREPETIDVSDINSWMAFKSLVKALLFDFKSFSVQAYDEVEVPDETHEEAGIYETVTKNYEVTTTTTHTDTYVQRDTTKDGFETKIEAQFAAQTAAEGFKREVEKNEGMSVSYTISYDKYYKKFNPKYHFTINFVITYANTETRTETIEVKKTLYDATDYTVYNAGSEAVIGQIHTISTDLSEIGSTGDQDFIDAVDDQKAAYEAAAAAKDAADKAKTAYDEALKKVKEAQDKVDALEGISVKKKDIVSAKYDLAIAEANLEAAKKTKEIADEEVKKAEESLDDANKKLDDIKKKNADSGSSNQGGSSSSEGGDNSDDGNGGATGGSGTVTPSNLVNPVAANVNTNADAAVLGAARTSSVKSTTTAKAETSVGVGSNSSDTGISPADAYDSTKASIEDNSNIVVSIEDEDTAKADTVETQKAGFAWWWLLILAAIAGVSVEEYTRRKKAKENAEGNRN